MVFNLNARRGQKWLLLLEDLLDFYRSTIIALLIVTLVGFYPLSTLAHDLPGSTYEISASNPPKSHPKVESNNIGVLIQAVESWASYDALVGVGYAFSDHKYCNVYGDFTYDGGPKCIESADLFSPWSHLLSCTALYTVPRNDCGYPTGSGRYAYANYPVFQYVVLNLDKTRGEPCPKKVGNPCDPASANKYEHITDFAGGDHIPSFSRTFNSLPNNGAISPLGAQWQHNYDRHIAIINPLPDRPEYTTLNVNRADGKVFSYFNQGGNWQTTPDIADKLTQTTNGWVYSRKNGASETYDSAGYLAKETDLNGRTTYFTYANGQLTTITGPYGHTLTLGYVSGRLATLTDPNGMITQYGYDANNNLTTVTYPDGTGQQYHYEDTNFIHHLTGISYVDATGVLARFSTYAYDTLGRAVLTQHAQTDNAGPQEKFTLAYSNTLTYAAMQTLVTDGVGNVTAYNYSGNNYASTGTKLLTSTSINGDLSTSTGYVYDTNDNLTCHQNEKRNVIVSFYNTANQRTGKSEGRTGSCSAAMPNPETRDTTYQYLSPALDLVTVIESPSVAGGSTKKRTTIGYTDTRFPKSSTSITQSGFTPAGAVVSRSVALSYNAQGQVSTINGPRAPSEPGMNGIDDVTTLAYYTCISGGACGQLMTVTNALGQITTYNSYYADGRMQTITAPNGLLTRYTYDTRGRVATLTLTISAGVTASRSFTYTPDGQVKTLSITPDNLTYTYAYDAAQDLRSITDTFGNRVEYKYDLKGNRTSTVTKNPDGTQAQSLIQAHDIRNRVQSINHGGNLTTLINDAVGNLTAETDPNHTAASSTANTVHQYDALNRLFQTTDLLTGLTQYAYDVNDRMKHVSAPNTVSTTYSYDDLGNLLQEVSADRGTTTYTYDAAGNVVTQTDARSVVVTYRYDALNRPTLTDYPGTANDITYTYDNVTGCTFGIGRLCRTTQSNLTTTYAYNGFGQRTDKVQVLSGGTYTTHTNLDPWGRVTGLTYPGGRQATYTRDARGRISSVSATVNGVVTPLTSSRTYRADDLLSSQIFGNGLIDSRLYTDAGRLYNQFIGTADTRVYGYDYNGNLKSKQSLPEVASYTYDDLNRLKAATDPTPIAFTYDANGNRKTGAGITTTYVLNTNRLATIAGKSVSLTANGNLATDPVNNLTYTYNNANELATAMKSGTLIGTYGYDPQHLRVSKVSAEGSILYHYDDAGHLLQETTSAGVLIRAYVWADDMPVVQITQTATGEALTYLHTDALNTPRLATATTSNVVWRWEGNAFGDNAPTKMRTPTGIISPTINLRFAGQYYDKETGLHYNWNRYYDPRLGRYITSDPIGLAGGLNTYTYVTNNPSRFVDPSGLFFRPLPVQIIEPIISGPKPLPPGIDPLLPIVPDPGLLPDPGTPKSEDCPMPCPPCMTMSGKVVPVGTISYRPVDTPSEPQHGIVGPHYNIYKANQYPAPKCDCFWQPKGAVPPSGLPVGAIPIEPFAN
jgi:RHS repeat-associated protein